MDEMKRARVKVGLNMFPVGFSMQTPNIYRKAFKSNFWTDISIESNRTDDNYNIPETERIAWQVAWAVAKTANPKIPPLDKWVEKFKNISGVAVMNKAWEKLHE